MWYDNPFSQRNKTPERAVGGGGWRQQGKRIGQNLKKGAGVRQYRGGLHKIGGVKTLLPTMISCSTVLNAFLRSI